MENLLYQIPDRSDLSNGRYLNRHRRFSLDSPADVRRWNAILAWMKMRGVPTESIRFFVVPDQLGENGFGPTQIEMTGTASRDGEVETVRTTADASLMFGEPDNHLLRFKSEFNLPKQDVFESFPGTTMFLQQTSGNPVVGNALDRNTPGWTNPFPRYYELGSGFVPGMNEFTAADGSRYRFTTIQGDANPGGPFAGTQALSVWERIG